MPRMIGRAVAVLLAVFTMTAAAPRTEPGATAAKSASVDGWPDTRAGDLARRWVLAFSTSEKAMREFNRTSLAKESLAKRGAEERVVSYRKLRERFGTLVLGAVEKSAPHELSVKLMASDASMHGFTFTVEKRPPHKLIAVSMKERRGHGFGGFHH